MNNDSTSERSDGDSAVSDGSSQIQTNPEKPENSETTDTPSGKTNGVSESRRFGNVSDETRACIESALFVTDEPLKAADLSDLLDIDGHQIKSIMDDLKREYDDRNRGVQLIKVSGGYKMTTRERHYDFLKQLFGERTLPRLSDSAVEALVIIAYHQPIIRQELESIRGVNCQSVLQTLLDKNFIRISGRRDEIGRPIEYRTSRKFLDYFGLNTLNDLPDEDDISELFEDNFESPANND